MWRDETPDPVFTDTWISTWAASSRRAWPAPSGRRTGSRSVQAAGPGLRKLIERPKRQGRHAGKRVAVEGETFELGHGDVVIAAITSCTNTSNPDV